MSTLYSSKCIERKFDCFIWLLGLKHSICRPTRDTWRRIFGLNLQVEQSCCIQSITRNTRTLFLFLSYTQTPTLSIYFLLSLSHNFLLSLSSSPTKITSLSIDWRMFRIWLQAQRVLTFIKMKVFKRFSY